jgi:hypothetical protein
MHACEIIADTFHVSKHANNLLSPKVYGISDFAKFAKQKTIKIILI